MLADRKIEQGFLEAGAFATLLGAGVSAGTPDINQQLLLDQQVSHTLIISAQVPPLPFDTPALPPNPNCFAAVSIKARWFREVNPMAIANHAKYPDGSIRYQDGDIVFGPAVNQTFEVSDGSLPTTKLITDNIGQAIRADGTVVEVRKPDGSIQKRNDVIIFHKTSDSEYQGRTAITIKLRQPGTPSLTGKIPCDSEQQIPALIYSTELAQNAQLGTPIPSQRPTSSDAYFYTAPDGRIIPRGQQAAVVVEDSRRSTTITEVRSPTPAREKISVTELTAQALRIEALVKEAVSQSVRTAVVPAPTSTPTPAAQRAEQEGSNPVAWILDRFGETITSLRERQRWMWALILVGLIVGFFVIRRILRRGP